MGRLNMPVQGTLSYVSKPPPLRRVVPIPLPPIEEPSFYMQFSNDASANIVDPQVCELMRTIYWHIALGPRRISPHHDRLDRRLFLSTNANNNVASSSTTQVQIPSILIHVYTPGQTLPALHTAYLSLRLYPHARVRDFFYEIADCLAGAVEVSRVASLSGDEQRRVSEAQMWRVAEGFTEIGTTSILPWGKVVDGVEGENGARVLMADFLNGNWVISDLTPVNTPDGVFSVSVLFKD